MKKIFLLVLFCWFTMLAFGQDNKIFQIDSLPSQGILLDKNWKYKAEDNLDFAKPEFDDSAWESIDPTRDIVLDLPQIPKDGKIGWFRLRLSLDEALLNTQISLIIQQTGASEIYLNGLKIITNGIIDKNKIVAKDPLWKPFPINFNHKKEQIIAIRYALQPNLLYTTLFENYNPAFWIKVMDSEKAVIFHYSVTSKNLIFIFLIIGIFSMIFIIHLSFHILYPNQNENLYFSLFSLFYLLGSLSQYFYWLQPFEVAYKFYLGNLAFLFFIIADVYLLTSVYLFLEKRKDFLYFFLAVYAVIAVVFDAYLYDIGWKLGGAMFQLSVQLNIVRIATLAVLKKQKSSWIIAIGAFSTLLLFALFLSQGTFTNTSFLLSLPPKRMFNYIMFCLSLPISTSLFLAYQFANISNGLKRKIIENETLSAEKQQILENQKDELEKQVTERTLELKEANEELQDTNEELNTTLQIVEQERQKSDNLLLNILPAETAQELKEKGSATPQHYDLVSVLFTDFKGFTKAVEHLKPIEIIQELDFCFNRFDEIVEKYGLERIKTIGDAYMAVGGLPVANQTNPIDAVQAGLEIQAFMNNLKQQRETEGKTAWECRLGIHSGEVIAGVVGTKKFAYDIWGDTVNLASRMESSGEVGKVNISGTTYEMVKDVFHCAYRGKIEAKNKGEVEMYFVALQPPKEEKI